MQPPTKNVIKQYADCSTQTETAEEYCQTEPAGQVSLSSNMAAQVAEIVIDILEMFNQPTKGKKLSDSQHRVKIIANIMKKVTGPDASKVRALPAYSFDKEGSDIQPPTKIKKNTKTKPSINIDDSQDSIIGPTYDSHISRRQQGNKGARGGYDTRSSRGGSTPSSWM